MEKSSEAGDRNPEERNDNHEVIPPRKINVLISQGDAASINKKSEVHGQKRWIPNSNSFAPLCDKRICNL